jgi:hypothetical protein
MIESGVEIFLRGDSGQSVFLRFEDASRERTKKETRNFVAKQILELLPSNARNRSQRPSNSNMRLLVDTRPLVDQATAAWQCGAMSNFGTSPAALRNSL